MSYLNQAHDPRRRATAVVTVGAVHAVLAVGLITGLTINVDRIIPSVIEATNIPLDPPRPEPTEPPPPQPDPIAYVPPAPVPPIPLPPVPGPTYEEFDPTRLIVDEVPYIPAPRPTVQPAPPAPIAPPKRAVPRNGNWITDDDYSRRAILDEAEGSVGFRLVIGTNGRVSSCELTRSSGHGVLDDATCKLISNRARFDPATDETGARVVSTYSGSVLWQLPD